MVGTAITIVLVGFCCYLAGIQWNISEGICQDHCCAVAVICCVAVI